MSEKHKMRGEGRVCFYFFAPADGKVMGIAEGRFHVTVRDGTAVAIVHVYICIYIFFIILCRFSTIFSGVNSQGLRCLRYKTGDRRSLKRKKTRCGIRKKKCEASAAFLIYVRVYGWK